MKRVPLPAIFLALLAWPGMVHAQIDYTWTNPDGGSYETASNWTPNSGIPDSDNEGAIFTLDNQYVVSLTSDISTDYAIVRDGTATLALGTISNPRTYKLNSLTVAPIADGENPHLSLANGTLRATYIQVAGGGQLEQVKGGGVFDFDNGAATVTGSGSTWTNVGPLNVGRSGASTLLIEEGGNVESGSGSVGTEFDSIGSVIVTGSGSIWNNAGRLRVGRSGAGALLIEEGGNVESSSGGIIGSELGSIGSVIVTGSGSTWTGGLSVGGSGIGKLLIEEAGNIESGSGSTIGSGLGSIGSVIVTGGGSTWTNGGDLNVGRSGAGKLLIEDGGKVENSSGYIGRYYDSTGTVTVTGSGSAWTNVDDLRVGYGGDGALLIKDGGKVENGSGYIGTSSDSTGTVTVTGSGSAWNIDNWLWMGGSSGTGTLNIGPGGTVTVAAYIALIRNGLLRLQGGTLTSPVISFAIVWGGGDFGGEFEWTSGILHVEQFRGDLVNGGHIEFGGGTLAPGQSQSVGETTITGSYTHGAAASLEIEIGGLSAATGHDHITVDGNLLLEGGELRLALIDDFVPNFAHTLTILEFDGAMFGQFDNVTNGERLDTADGLGSFRVHYGPQSAFNPKQIVLSAFEPDPGINNIFGDRFEQ